MKGKGIKVVAVTGVTAFALTAGIIGSHFVSKAQPNEYKVVESGVIKENEPQVVNLSNVVKTNGSETDGGIQNIEQGTQDNLQRVAGESEIQYAHSKTEDEWTALATDALNKYFDVDVSNLQSRFSALPAIEEYDIEESASVLFAENLDDITNAIFYNVIFAPESGTVQEVYDVFSDTAGGKKVVAKSVTVDEAKDMAKEFIINKELAKEENMEYIGGKVTSEGRIHVSFKVDDNKSISVGIDTYTNEIKSFFIRDLEYANAMLFSSPEDAVG